jgi:UTP--glucose-1-phosphate uridylyltransferase
LDEKFYKKIDMFLQRFPNGAPSLMECDSLRVEGDVTFEADVRLSGHVHIVNATPLPRSIPPGTHLSGEVHL